jgi:hypothetical protein
MLMLSSQKLEVMVLMNLAGNSSTVIGVLSAPTQAPPLLPQKKGANIGRARDAAGNSGLNEEWTELDGQKSVIIKTE